MAMEKRTRNVLITLAALVGGILVVWVSCFFFAFALLRGTDGDTGKETPIDVRALTAIPTEVKSQVGREVLTGEKASVTRIVDGDTIEVELDGRSYRVRYIGMDAPERGDPFFDEATESNRRLVEDQIVILVKDVSETDRYGRLLRYVYLEDGTMVNAELVRLGFAQIATFPPDVTHQELFLQLQQEAREAGRGLWGQADEPAPPLSTPTLVPAQPTAPLSEPTGSAAVCDCSSNLYNCGHFSTHDDTQACYVYCITIGRGDVHDLDGDGDGFPCE
jgi:micrococcal nuclease